MTDIGLQIEDTAAEVSNASPRDYFALLKPRVMSLVVFTALVGMLRAQTHAPAHLHPVIGFVALLAIAVGAGASGALNMWYDADIDAVMTRTRRRPIPAGAVRSDEALTFGLILSIASVLVLGLVTNALAAGLLAFTIAFYVVIYTMWLKRWTPQNIVIGGAAGALPPVVAWAATTGTVSLEPVLLFAIIFMWTPPHFWALALFKSGDYERAGVPMLPNVAGERATRWQILLYSLVLAPLGAAPWLLGFTHALYGAVSVTGGAVMVALAIAVLREGPEANHRAAKRLFGVSILYLFGLFAALLGEALIGMVVA